MAGLVDRADRLAEVPDLTRGGPVRDRAEDILTLQLEEVPDLVQQVGDTSVLFGGVLAGHAAMLARPLAARVSELEHREGLVDRAARAEDLGVLRGGEREVRAVVDG